MPLVALPPLSTAMNRMPTSARPKNSGDPKASTTGRMIGIEAASATAPMIEPTSELISTAPRARPVWPCLAIGWPSRITDADSGSPGTPNRIDVTSPNMIETESIPSRKANAACGDMLKVNGSISASVVGAEIPGRIPIMKPMTMLIIISRNVCGESSCTRPDPAACSIVSIALDLPETKCVVSGRGAARASGRYGALV